LLLSSREESNQRRAKGTAQGGDCCRQSVKVSCSPSPWTLFYEGEVKSFLLLFSASSRVASAFVYGRHALLCLLELSAPHLHASAHRAEALMETAASAAGGR